MTSSFATSEVAPGAGVPASFAPADVVGQTMGQASSFTSPGAGPSSSFEVKPADRAGVTLTIRIDSGSSQT